MKTQFVAALIGILGILQSASAAEPILLWIEGENAARSEIHHNAWFDAVDPLELSGGKQIGSFAEPAQSPAKDGPIDGRRIIDPGKRPWQVVKTRGEIAVRNAGLTKATVLDANGMPVANLPLAKDANGVKITLPENALYVCLQ